MSHPATYTFRLVIVTLLAALSACSKESQPLNPSPPPSCRTYASSYTTLAIAGATSLSTVGTCTFNRQSLQSTCVADTVGTGGFATNQVTVTTYASIDDILAEVATVPPLTKSVGVAVTGTGTTGPTVSAVSYVYDAQKRVTRENGGGYSTTWSAWDSEGRPTTGTTAVTGGQTNVESVQYNNTARTRTRTSSSAGQSVMCSETFDANGNQIATACPGSTSTTNIVATAQICR